METSVRKEDPLWHMRKMLHQDIPPTPVAAEYVRMSEGGRERERERASEEVTVEF